MSAAATPPQAASIARLQGLETARDAALAALVRSTPFVGFLGVEAERRGDEISTRLAFDPKLIGNPVLPAIHGGATGAFLEITGILSLAWAEVWRQIELGTEAEAAAAVGAAARLPKTIDITVDYLRSGRVRDMFGRATITKHGRRVANVRVEAWQEERSRPIAAAHGHFLIPEGAEPADGPADRSPA